MLVRYLQQSCLTFDALGKMTTEATTTATSDASLVLHEDVVTIVCSWITLLVIVIGITGNTISIIVFGKLRLSTGTVGQYLIALAIADNVMLISHIPVWVSDKPLETNLLNEHDWVCRLTFYLKYACRLWSASLTLTVTVERYLFVAHPLKVLFQEHGVHRILIPVTLTMSLGFVIYSLFMIKVTENTFSGIRQCFVVPKTREQFLALDIAIVRIFGDIILGVLILIFTVLTIRALLRAQKIRNVSLRQASARLPSRRLQKKSQKSSREWQITRMLLMLAVVFLLFKVPYTVLYYVTWNWHRRTPPVGSTAEEIIRKTKQVSSVLGLAGYAFNFFVYVTLVPSYRRNLCKVVRCRASDG